MSNKIILDPTAVDEVNYPMAWLLGSWSGTYQIGGHFDIKNSHFAQEIIWGNTKKNLKYSMRTVLAKFDDEGNFKQDNKELITESGNFEIIKERPKNLKDDKLFPISANITTSWLINKKQIEVWSTKYVGIIGNGKIELVSDEINILNPDWDIANNLWRSKRVYGYVNGRIMWVWDIAQIGARKGDEGLQSLLSAGLGKQ